MYSNISVLIKNACMEQGLFLVCEADMSSSGIAGI